MYSNLFVLLLATFLGLEIIRRVSPLLHTPLMSLTNAISAISIVGAIVVLGEQTAANRDPFIVALATLAVFASMTNLVSGFLITDRMLRMFRRRDKPSSPSSTAAAVLPIWLLAGTLQPGSLQQLPSSILTNAGYLVATALFILSLKWLSSLKTARFGVIAGEIGMAVAVIAALLQPEVQTYGWIIVGMAAGTALGIPLGLLMPMTAVPQRTALSHAFGGAAVGLIGTAKYYLLLSHGGAVEHMKVGIISFEVLLGFLTFTGSLMAFGKLQEILPTRPVVYRGQNIMNLLVLAGAVTLGVLMTVNLTAWSGLYPLFVVLALLFGVLLIIPIGGADMPTVISLLNSYAGLAASAMGFALDNKLLIVAGALDGASGLILSIIMCKAMNRSFTNVLFGAFGQTQVAAAGTEQRPVRSASPEEAAAILGSIQSLIIVPGYGMAVAQAQHKIRELFDLLTRRGVDVKFAIHPVAGRMPGHMNVLLAESDIPYDRLHEMEEINGEFSRTDVALVVGANDITNPAARSDRSSPIFGMPILDVDKARTVMVVKRGMGLGFAGIDNDLYYMDRTLMLFGDARGFVTSMVKELSEQH